MPYCRSCAVSPIVSGPATMPATIEAASTPALLFHRDGRCSSARARKPVDSAEATGRHEVRIVERC